MGCGSSSDKEGSSVAPSPKVPSAPKSLDTQDGVRKFHGLIRWNKEPEEIQMYLKLPNAISAVDAQNGNGPLHIAAQNGHLDTVKQLIALNADVNLQNAKGNVALHMCVGYDYYAVSMLLINSGADVNIKNSRGFAANTGLEGDRSLASCAIVSAETVDDFKAALDLMSKTFPRGMKKDFYIKCGLKMKKQFPEEWKSKDMQAIFTALLNDFDKDPAAATAE